MKYRSICLLAVGLAIAGGASADNLYLVGDSSIFRTELDGTGPVNLTTTNARFIALDLANERMYWTVGTGVNRANLDGSASENIVSGLTVPLGIAVDSTGGKIYWVDEETGKVQRANLDGSSVQDHVTGLSKPVGIALDVPSGKLYWTDEGAGKVQRANLADGSGLEDLVTGLTKPTGLALDLSSGHIYWGDQNLAKIQRSNLDGSSVTDLVTNGVGAVLDTKLDVVGGKIYWTDDDTGALRRANLNGGEVETLPPIAFFLAIDVPEPSLALMQLMGLATLLALARLRRR